MALAAVIFDVDGTLVDTNGVHIVAWERALARYGYRVPAEQLAPEMGKGGDHLIPDLLGEDVEREHGDELREAHGDEFLRLAATQPLRAFPGVRPLFDAIHERGLRAALATSAKMDYLDATLDSAGLDLKPLADELVTADEAASSKPAPDIVIAALDKLKLEADQCVMVGDTPHDASACKQAGVAFFGLTCGGRTEADLRQAGAVGVWADPVDLLAHLDEALALVGSATPV